MKSVCHIILQIFFLFFFGADRYPSVYPSYCQCIYCQWAQYSLETEDIRHLIDFNVLNVLNVLLYDYSLDCFFFLLYFLEEMAGPFMWLILLRSRRRDQNDDTDEFWCDLKSWWIRSNSIYPVLTFYCLLRDEDRFPLCFSRCLMCVEVAVNGEAHRILIQKSKS